MGYLLRNIFYKVYRIELTSTDGKQRNMRYMRGLFVWSIIKLSEKIAAEKTEKEQVAWTIENITRLI